MFKKLLFLFLFVTSISYAQYSIKGTMTPPEESDWVILYKINGPKQKFISNGTIVFEDVNIGGNVQKVGRFELKLPADAQTGVYRVTYRNQGAGFIDVYFNNENIEFVFNPQYPEESVLFTRSRENKVYREYLEQLNIRQVAMDSLQSVYLKDDNKKTKKAYKKAFKEQEEIQDAYEGKSEGMLVNTFIKANKSTNSSSIFDDTQEYLEYVVESFFENVDFSDQKLYRSPFIIEKVTNYIFYLNIEGNQEEQQKVYKQSITNVMKQVKDNQIQKEILEYLITRFTNARNSEIVDFLFAEYYDEMDDEFKDEKFKNDKLAELLASQGRVAPDFSWKEGEKELSLSGLNDGENYLLIFWSTQCGHCVKEVPEVYEYMNSTHPNTSVIAFAIEDDEKDFTDWATNKLPKWHNAIGTHPEFKLKNETVQKYRIEQTPTYFLLDKDKKIIAVPNTVPDIKDYLNGPSKEEEGK
ncbi:TlpA family protein disulfide reductase [Tenacibaculum sp. 190524A05c]|uniref:TlpA family protein disulfide reductase n=1 Tax=Tenacibaculum platacis TaxID=3137852 RepID=A0ABM9NSY6_9FLAO